MAAVVAIAALGVDGLARVAGPGLEPAEPSEWRAIRTGTTQHLTGVWGSPGSGVYVVGANGTLLRRSQR
jgi:hypothetical protein